MAYNTIEWFKVMLIMCLFYSVSINILTYTMPSASLHYVTGFSDLAGSIDLNDVAGEVQNSVEAQTNIPVIEIGALVFYSGNILIDLLLNFAFAIPEMIGLLITGFLMLVSVDAGIARYIQLFASVTIMVVYFISIIQLLLGVRSGRVA